jgi:two-component system sensor histidine kinase and response regulator WspE
MEELFVAAQAGRIVLNQAQIDLLLKGVDLLGAIAHAAEPSPGETDAWQNEADRYIAALNAALEGSEGDPGSAAAARAHVPDPAMAEPESVPMLADEPQAAEQAHTERALRVSADNLNRMLDLAGESLVESRRLKPFNHSLARLKRMQRQVARALEMVREVLPRELITDEVDGALATASHELLACRTFLAERLTELEAVDHQAMGLAQRLYDQALAIRMRPFADGVVAYPRLVRDLGKSLGKNVLLELAGLGTPIDRDILERLDAPLGHLLRNAVDHGAEEPDARIASGKPVQAVIRLEAQHNAGTLQIVIADDGPGIDLERLRTTIVQRKHATEETAARLNQTELLEFLFLPGFTMKQQVTEISGRGVGLDVVHDMVKQVGGRVRVFSRPGEGTRFELVLPLTLSVTRALLVEIGGEPYAFPFTHILRALRVPTQAVDVIEGRQHFTLDGQSIGLAAAQQILQCGSPPVTGDAVCVVVIGSPEAMYGIVVDRFLGGRELVVQTLDPRLGKIKDISAGAPMEDGSPLLILDVEDMIRSMEKLAANDRLDQVSKQGEDGTATHRRKRVLVVDDSFTVRELQRKLLDHHGYAVDVVVTDIDMPRMDGIELLSLIKKDPDLAAVPVIILSYKDREEDRRRGLEGGADYYLTKGSYHSDALIEAVVDLIGEAP